MTPKESAIKKIEAKIKKQNQTYYSFEQGEFTTEEWQVRNRLDVFDYFSEKGYASSRLTSWFVLWKRA